MMAQQEKLQAQYENEKKKEQAETRLRVGGVCVHSYVNLLNFRVVFFILARQPEVEIRAGRFNFLNNAKLLNNGNRARTSRAFIKTGKLSRMNFVKLCEYNNF